ncbi:MAG: coenzyme F420-0:L-glutamate ligase [Pseudomonadota bacterium]
MLSITAIEGLPEIREGMDLARTIGEASRRTLSLAADAVLVVAQKIVSKAEGRLVALNTVVPGEEARALAEQVNKDPRLVELILAESRSVIRKVPGVLIVEHRTGHILANAGIDTSNIEQDAADPRVLLWPRDPDASARRLSDDLSALLGQLVPVVVNDSIGRPWRYGTVGHAIGCCGIEPLWNQIGDRDRFGNKLRVTEPATADAMAAAAALVQGEGAEGLPAVWIQGCRFKRAQGAGATAMLRNQDRDLFR